MSQISATELGESNVTIDALITLARAIVGENVRTIRKEKGWTQDKLARKSKLSAGHISAIERGWANMYLDTMARIAKALKVPLRRLLEGLE